MQRYIFFFFLFFTLFAPQLKAQSLFQDTEDMVRALEVLSTKNQSPDSIDIEALSAMAEVLAILKAYDQEVLSDSLAAGNWNQLLENYTDNDLIQKALRSGKFTYSDSLPATINSLYGRFNQQVLSGPRQKILNLLHAEEAVSPANYLSVNHTLQKYSLPPVKNTTAMAQAAQGSNGNITNGIFNSTAIIQGLFDFVLDRAKDEVVINFLENMLNEDSPEFKVLFPGVIEQFSNKTFTYSNSFIERLRQAFYEDIQQMSVRLPLLMLEDDYFKPLQSEPVAYSFLALYSMVGMSQQDIPVEEIMPITHRYLYQSYEEARKEVNLELADVAFGQAAYNTLVTLVSQVYDHIARIFQDLDQAEYDLRETVSDYESRFPNSVGAPVANDFLDRKEYDLEVLLGNNTGPDFDLSLLPSLLRGKLDAQLILQYNTLASYDKFFGRERSPQQWRAAGLEIASNLNGTWYREESIADILYAWQKDIARYKIKVDQWKNIVDPEGALQAALAQVENDRSNLVDTILATRSFWNTLLTYDQDLALGLLASIAADFDDIDQDLKYDDTPMDEGQIEVDKLNRKKEKLLEVENRLIVLNTKLESENPDFPNVSPVQLFMANKKGTTPYAYIIANINDLSKELNQVDHQLFVLDTTYAREESQIRNNAKPILQTTGFATQLMYGLRSNSPEHKWITKVELDSMLDGGLRQNIYLGLLTQRLSKVQEVGLFSPTGIAQLVTLTVADLQTLPLYRSLRASRLGNDSTAVEVPVDSLAFYDKAAFIVNTLNRMLELPLVVKRGDPRKYVPLINQVAGLEQVPDVANLTLDFIYYLNIKDHRHSVSSMLRLFSLLHSDISQRLKAKDAKDNKRQAAIGYLQKYGDFIADLIDAESGEQVEDLLNNIADPPGSSRLKRTQELTVGLNAYLGGTLGWEKWTANETLLADDGYVGLAPTMPIGITMSTLLGKKKTSFSLFVSFLDLGALLTYRAGSDALGENVFTFKNMFKPGLQLQWNIKKTPFYLAAGGQYGPQIRELDDRQVTFSAVRYFLGFGVDVPIKTLFQR